LNRLATKTLDGKFLEEIEQGLNCSPFEGQAVLQVVKEVYLPFLAADAALAPPGKVSLVAVSADEPPGKPVARCAKQTVCVTVHRGGEDDRLLAERGPTAFRRARLADVCQEAVSQNGLLTVEDLAYRVFFVSPRTITRDLGALRAAEPGRLVPLRSNLQDIGPVLTHRTQIVRLALEGKTTSQICRILHHSPPAVANYVSTFARCVQLARQGMQPGQIAFLLRRGPGLVGQYLELLAQCEHDKNLAYHLDELLRLGTSGGEKKTAPGRRSHG
jgi:hypothetical protein